MSHVRAAALLLTTLAWFGGVPHLHAQAKMAPKQLWESKDASRFQRLALSPDGKVLAYTRHEFGPEKFKTHVRLCDARSGKELHLLAYDGKNKGELPVDPKNPNRPPVAGGVLMGQLMSLEMVTALVFSPDSKTLATLSNGLGSNEVTLKLWDVASGKQQKLFPLSMAMGQGLAYFPDGRLLAAGMSTKMTPYLKIVETKQGKSVGDLLPELQAKLNKYYPKQAILTSFELAADGRTFVVGIGNFETSFVHVYDMKSQKLEFNIAQLANGRQFNAAALSPDGKTVAVARYHGMVASGMKVDTIDRATKKKLASIAITEADGNTVGQFNEVPFRFTPDSRYLLTGGGNTGKVQVWDAQTGAPLGEHLTGLKRVTALAMGPNLLVTASDSNNGIAGQFGGAGLMGGQPPIFPGGNPPALPPGFNPGQPPPQGKPPFPGNPPQGFPPPEGKFNFGPMPPMGGVGGFGGGFQMPAAESAIKVWEWTSPSQGVRSSSMKD